MPSIEPFGPKIQSLRKSLGLTQLELAIRAGVSERTIRNAERGHPLRRKFLDYIGTAMGVAIQDVARHPQQVTSLLDGRRHLDSLYRMFRNMPESGDVSEILEMMHPQLEIGIRIDPRFRGADYFNKGFSGRSGAQQLVDRIREYRGDVVQWNAKFRPPRGDGNLLIIEGTDDCIYRDGGREASWWVYIVEFADHRIRRVDEYAGVVPGHPPDPCELNYNELNRHKP